MLYHTPLRLIGSHFRFNFNVSRSNDDVFLLNKYIFEINLKMILFHCWRHILILKYHTYTVWQGRNKMSMTNWGLFYQYEVIAIPGWISNYIQHKVWDALHQRNIPCHAYLSNNVWVTANDDFCHEWGDSPKTFTTDEVTSEDHCRVAAWVTTIVSHGTLFYFLYISLIPEHMTPFKTVIECSISPLSERTVFYDSALRHNCSWPATSPLTPSTGIVTSYSWSALSRANWLKVNFQQRITTVNIDFPSPGIHNLSHKKIPSLIQCTVDTRRPLFWNRRIIRNKWDRYRK